MEATSEHTNDRNGAATTWTDVADASAEADAAKVTREVVEDVIDVKLTDADMADLLRANGADEDAKAAVDRAIDDLKAELKEKKAESEAIAARIKDRNRAGARGTTSKKDRWIIESIFSQNTVRYLDPKTERVVLERPMRLDERQLELTGARKSDDKQLSLDDVEPGDASADVTDPDALLKAAMEPDEDERDDGDPEDE